MSSVYFAEYPFADVRLEGYILAGVVTDEVGDSGYNNFAGQRLEGRK